MEIILFCYGDSNGASTWSNIPFLMAQNLERLGHTIQRVNLEPNKRLEFNYNRLIFRLINRNGGGYSFQRSWLFKILSYIKIRKNVKKYKLADFCIFLNFDFYNKYSSIPSLLFCDWTYKTYLEERIEKPLTLFDKRFIHQQNNAIKKARVVLPLFSETVVSMKKQFPSANICQIPFNVINNMSDITDLSKDQLKKKYFSNYLLFIGRPKYRCGLLYLLDSVKAIKNDNDSDIKIEVIGMEESDLQGDNIYEFVHFNGFLHKDIPSECEKYYNLLLNAKCIINPTPKWAAYSSIVEGMYFYNPVIIPPFNQFINDFGNEISFGFYIDKLKGYSLSSCIQKIFSLNLSEYLKMSIDAHENVKNFDWRSYAIEMIKIMKLSKLVLRC